LARNDEALNELELARAAADAPELISRIEISLSAALSAGGRRSEAEALLDKNVTNDDPVLSALARSQRALLALGDGALENAATDLRQSIGALEQSESDGDAAARAVGNLAYCEMALGLLNDAEASYQRAVDLGTRFGEGLVVAGCLQNLGYLAMRRGHLGEAIERLTEAEQTYRAMNAPARNLSTLYDDLAETHRIAGMTGPAVRHASAALDAVLDGGNQDKIAEARYRLAACALDDGDAATATAQSALAADAFAAAGRTVWMHRAWSISLDVGDADQGPDDDTVADATRAAEELERSGWLTDGLRIRNRVAQRLLAHDTGGPDVGRIERLLDNRPDNPDQSIMSKLEALFASVVSARANGRAATDDLLAAHALITSHYQRLVDPELRAGAARLAGRFRRLSIDEVENRGEPAELLITEERWRALSFDLPRVVPSSDERLAAKSEELRHAAATLAATDRWDPQAAATVQRLEAEIQPLSLQTRSRFLEAPDRTSPLDLTRLRQALDGRTFLEWVEIGSTVTGVMVTPDRVESWACGAAADLQAGGAIIMSTLARILRPGLGAAGLDRTWEALLADCRTAAGTLLPPSLDVGAGLVLSPPPWLAGLPWSLVVDRPDLPICVTPSATTWLGRRTGDIPASVGIAVGPDLAYGSDDMQRIAGTFDRTETLSGPAATADAVRSLIARSGIMHIAAHGTFRSDSPRFSTLLFDDGPLALYELDAETSVAPLVVLAACDAGRTASRTGSELLGFGPTLLTAGATNVVAPSVPVADREMSAFIGTFYEELPGRRPSDALAAARAQKMGGSVHDRALASAVLCSGADSGYVSTAIVDRSDPM
ncbi:MAG: CHAT domain-containing tetratricopeptide repeat protein, partial [Actinomycetota bacterium]